ncbi:hypothetical protein BC936DRAFT_143236 [Jimgerdemannia flammicorona]|uniref:Uncharacterized protein n=1 Tax=Jimgerdemannia flammicorona TaxID=994334 RepID=A0A432ZZN9_9FUNG|nr:hypothetical protein BC936DRAFT_143236 [Jimgerdemannia flammicorona]
MFFQCQKSKILLFLSSNYQGLLLLSVSHKSVIYMESLTIATLLYRPYIAGAASIDSNDPPLRHLIENLKSLKRATEFQLANEATRSLYVESFLVASVIHFENDIILRPQKLLRGKTGRGPVDFSLESRPTGVQVGVTEIKKDDLRKGIAQNAVQLETARKRKREDEDVDLKKSYGIVTDARDWYFLRCEKGGDGRIQYSLSDPLIVELGKEVNSDHVKTVLERIIWLLGEMKKAEAEVEAELS